MARVGGTKYPDLERVRAAAPDLVLANAEENRREDVDALRAAGIPVWVTYPRTLDEALVSLGRLLAALGAADPPWLVAARAAWAAPFAGVRRTRGRPGLAAAVGRARARTRSPATCSPGSGWTTCTRRRRSAIRARRWTELRAAGADLVVLPDEPYAFTDDDGPEAFPGLPYALVSGRHLTWYGPSLATARARC